MIESPNKFNMVDMGGIDVVKAQGETVDGLFLRLLNSIQNCRYTLLYNWLFAGIFIVPTYVELVFDGEQVSINGLITVTSDDIVHVHSIEIPAEPTILPLNVEENGTYAPPIGVDGYAPVIVNVSGTAFYLYSLFLPENLTNQGWTDPSSGKSITLNAGAWQVEDGKLVAKGSYYSFNVPDSDCLVQCALTINPNFTPRAQADWWNQSTLFGTELPSYQNDLCATIVEYNGALYPSIGSGQSGYTKGTIPITKGTEHVISLAHIYTKYFLYVDGALSASLQYTSSGMRISRMGLFWNRDSGTTAVIGTISKLGVWATVPTTAPVLPSF